MFHLSQFIRMFIVLKDIQSEMPTAVTTDFYHVIIAGDCYIHTDNLSKKTVVKSGCDLLQHVKEAAHK